MPHIDPDNLRTVFMDDEALTTRRLARRHAGMLQITSGRIVACDPLVQPERQTFLHRVAQRGAHAVEVIAADVPALAVLWLHERASIDPAALRWELALIDGQSVDGLASDAYHGYPVDAGMGCFMDVDASAAIAERDRAAAAEPGYVSYYDDVLAPELGEHDTVDHCPLGPGSIHNVVIFRSGWGDGSYPSYWAFDTHGEAVALVTDFLVIEGGDARDDDERRDDAYAASLSPARRDALEALGRACEQGDAEAVRAALAAGAVGANEIIPSSGETAISSAIRCDRTEVLRVLLGDAPCPPMPAELHMKAVESYGAYARFLKRPRDPALLAVLDAAEARSTPSADEKKPAKPFWKRWLG